MYLRLDPLQLVVLKHKSILCMFLSYPSRVPGTVQVPLLFVLPRTLIANNRKPNSTWQKLKTKKVRMRGRGKRCLQACVTDRSSGMVHGWILNDTN